MLQQSSCGVQAPHEAGHEELQEEEFLLEEREDDGRAATDVGVAWKTPFVHRVVLPAG